MEHEEVTGPSAQEDQDDSQDKDDAPITPRAGLIIGVSAIVGVWVGRAAGAEAGSAAGIAVATMLDRVVRRDR